MFATIFDTAAILFVVAAVFGYLNHKLVKLPFAIGVMVSGLLASIVLLGVDAAFPKLEAGEMLRQVLEDVDFSEALMHGMLGFLLFAGALHTNMQTLRRWAAPILTLASVGVLISATIIGLGSYGIFLLLGFEVPLMYCFVFGALITPTDPVAVLGIMSAAGAPEDLEVKVIGESLFNDGVGVVVFTVLVSIAAGSGAAGEQAFSWSSILTLLATEVVGGILLGVVGGLLAYGAMKTIQEPNLEVLISVALVMGLTFAAFRLHSSAPLACVVAGLFLGNHGREVAMDKPTRRALDTVWEFIDEALNALLFLLLGLEVVIITLEWMYLAAAVLVILLGLLGRGAAVVIPLSVLGVGTEFRPGTKRVLWWGGIKGGISVALALSLPEFPGREVVLTATYATVVVSVLLQGLTIGRLVQRVAK